VLFGFRLVRELGRGAFGRVFLAEQIDLANRPVALKVASRLTGEVRTLARLQHTNIVPVYSTHEAPPVTALCMPYFGATTLASVVSDLITGERPTGGRLFVDAIRRRRDESKTEVGSKPAAIALLESASYVDSVLWLGERLADALGHAHERGIVHRDIKPGNVLLADDGQPMLLDFNLADDTNESVERARVGGTLPYMAPEQIRAFAGTRTPVDGRADVYALGAVLFQLLTRHLPYAEHVGQTETVLTLMQADRRGPIPELRPDNPDVSPAVEAIVRKCLEPDPAKRYPSAAALRDDLARQRANLPLKHVAEPSLRERMRKWAKRNPRLVSTPFLITYAATLLLAVSTATVWLSLQVRAARQDAELRERTERQDAERIAALRQFEDFRTLADTVRLEAATPSGSERVLDLGTAALARYSANEPGWEDRREVTRLPADERERLRTEIGEIAWLTSKAAALLNRDAERAARLKGVAEQPGIVALTPDQIATAVADGTRAGFLKASDLAFRGRYREALPLAAAYAVKHPTDFAAWMLAGKCHDMLSQYEDARGAYSTAAALKPDSARPFAARGELAFKYAKDLPQAKVDLDRAVQLDPNYFEARLTRALVLRSLTAYDAALEDLDALAAADRSTVRVRFVRAMVKEAKGDRAGAAADRDAALTLEPKTPEDFVTRGKYREKTDPKAALADYQAALKVDPLDMFALLNTAYVLGERLNQIPEALTATDRVLAVYPEHPHALGGRAVYLARLGQTDEAVAEAHKLLSGSPQASVYYHAGCVLALAARAEPRHRDEAIRLVATALLRGYGHEFVLSDPDLATLADDERFKKLVDGVKVMKELGEKR
jgi:serine/threonine protein kinase/lipoprotein NlpI